MINWDEPISKPIVESCIRCGDFVITDDKAEISIFMLDHYGENRTCKSEWVITCYKCGEKSESYEFWDKHQTMTNGDIWCLGKVWEY
jgi:hypothetical protein